MREKLKIMRDNIVDYNVMHTNVMMCGRELSLPIDVMIGRPPDGGLID